MKTFCTILAFAAFAASAQAIKLAEEETSAPTTTETEDHFTCEIPIAHCDDFYYGAVAQLYKGFLAPYFEGTPHAIHDLLIHHIEEAGEYADK